MFSDLDITIFYSLPTDIRSKSPHHLGTVIHHWKNSCATIDCGYG